MSRQPAGPSREAIAERAVDVGAVLVLGTVALLGLATTYTGIGFALVGVAGLVLGAGAVLLTRWRGWPPVAAVVIGLLALVLLGGPLTLRSQGASSALPLPGTLATLLDQLLHGWKDLLTTLPPVDGGGPLLVLPWVLGLTAGLLGVLLSGSGVGSGLGPAWVRTLLPVLPMVALLVGVVLLGVQRPQSLWLQGVVFSITTLGWLAVRAQRTGAAVSAGVGQHRRLLVGGAMVAFAGLVALPLSAGVPAGGSAADGSTSDDPDRVVLRSYVQPPFDVGQYPSPLASFRRYVKMPRPDAVNLYDTPLLTVEGAPAGSRLRIAALDSYDGTVWGAGGDTRAGAADDSFQRVSSTIDDPRDAASDPGSDPVDVEVTVEEGYAGVWLPIVGRLRSMVFEEGDVEAKQESFRYNLATATGVVPTGVRAGDVYRFTASATPLEVQRADDPGDQVADAANAAGFLETQARQWSGGATRPMARVLEIAEHLRTQGKYSDGVIASERIYHPGHHVKRLADEFVNAPIMVGNDEQYAAVMALLAAKVGVPSRVVLGAVLPEDGLVEGRDVSAWVELQVADGSWRTLPTERFMDTDRPAEQPPLSEQEMAGTVVPPPAPVPPPSTLADQDDTELESRQRDDDADQDGAGLPAWVRWLLIGVGAPLLLALLLAGAVLGLKAWRRRRRRTAAVVSRRIAGGWAELVDHARDLGQSVPVGPGPTRREQSRHLVSSAAPGLARRADAHVFGAHPPADDSAREFWELVDAERRSMSDSVGRRRRWRAALSPASLRRR